MVYIIYHLYNPEDLNDTWKPLLNKKLDWIKNFKIKPYNLTIFNN